MFEGQVWQDNLRCGHYAFVWREIRRDTIFIRTGIRASNEHLVSTRATDR